MGYAPVLEDWLWHGAFPLAAYAALLVAALLLRRGSGSVLFVIAGTGLSLLFIGIHNAWDAVIYLAMQQPDRPKGPAAPK